MTLPPSAGSGNKLICQTDISIEGLGSGERTLSVTACAVPPWSPFWLRHLPPTGGSLSRGEVLVETANFAAPQKKLSPRESCRADARLRGFAWQRLPAALGCCCYRFTLKASPGRGKLSPQVTDEGAPADAANGYSPLIRLLPLVAATCSPSGTSCHLPRSGGVFPQGGRLQRRPPAAW